MVVGVYIPGSISFNKVQMLITDFGAASTGTLTIHFGLYSLNGSTLSLANSASCSTNQSGTTPLNLPWITLATSATQDITPGNWYLGFWFTGSSAFVPGFAGLGGNFAWTTPYGGNLVRGRYSTTTNALPSSIETSAFNKEGSAGDANSSLVPYILISA